MGIQADRFVEYCISVAREFQARMSRLRVFVQHNLSSGTANEIILREFLSRHAPGHYDVGQGFMCDPSEQGMVSKQCDILVYSQNHYPVVYADGSIKVVWPRSVAMVIEVKTILSKKDVASAIENIVSAKKLNYRIAGVIFAFRSPKLETVIRNLQAYPSYVDPELSPTAILLLDKGIIIHNWGWARNRDYEAAKEQSVEFKPYAVRIAKKDKGAVVVAFLLLLFFQALEVPMLEADFINMLVELLEEYTEKKSPDIDIGQSLNLHSAA